MGEHRVKCDFKCLKFDLEMVFRKQQHHWIELLWEELLNYTKFVSTNYYFHPVVHNNPSVFFSIYTCQHRNWSCCVVLKPWQCVGPLQRHSIIILCRFMIKLCCLISHSLFLLYWIFTNRPSFRESAWSGCTTSTNIIKNAPIKSIITLHICVAFISNYEFLH